MATATLPIPQVKQDATLALEVSRTHRISFLGRAFLKYQLFPKVLREVNDTLDGERLGQLSSLDARELYAILAPLHDEAMTVLQSNQGSLWGKTLGYRWCTRVAYELERSEDIIESLAWGSDESLREFIDSSLQEVRLQG